MGEWGGGWGEVRMREKTEIRRFLMNGERKEGRRGQSKRGRRKELLKSQREVSFDLI